MDEEKDKIAESTGSNLGKTRFIAGIATLGVVAVAGKLLKDYFTDDGDDKIQSPRKSQSKNTKER